MHLPDPYFATDAVHHPEQAPANNDAPTDWAEQSMEGQADGATEFQLGNAGLLEPEFNVNVKLTDMQADPNDPLYSIKDFRDLNLCVTFTLPWPCPILSEYH